MGIMDPEFNGGSYASQKKEPLGAYNVATERTGEAGFQRFDESIDGLDREAQEPQAYGFYRGRRIHPAYRF